MKIGILTLPWNINYGSILQAYALQAALKRMGHEAWLVDMRRNKVPWWKYPVVIIRRVMLSMALAKDVSLLNERNRIIRKYARSFIRKYMRPMTFPVLTFKDLRKIKRYHFDAYVVGSDQVWRPKYVINIEDSFLGFLGADDKAKRVAYAASFGTSDWEFTPEQAAVCGGLLRKFHAVSVREESGVQLCKEHFGVDALNLIDPTMLLDATHYLKLAGQGKKSEGDLMVYILDKTDEKAQLVERVTRRFGYTPFGFNAKPGKISAPLRVEEWVRGFLDAKFVVADSFHACVFSILFNKPFIVYGNRQRGLARFDSLLRDFGLRGRFIASIGELSDSALNASIDWDKVNGILEAKREIARQFLLRAL